MHRNFPSKWILGSPKNDLCNFALRTPCSVRNGWARSPAPAEVQVEVWFSLPLPTTTTNTKTTTTTTTKYHQLELKIYAKSCPNHWTSMKNHWKSMQNQWKSMQNQWQIIESHCEIIENLWEINEDLCRINDKSLTINGLLAQCVIAEQGIQMLSAPKPFTLWPHARHGGGLRAALLYECEQTFMLKFDRHQI